MKDEEREKQMKLSNDTLSSTRTIKIDRRTYQLRQTRGEPNPQIEVKDVATGKVLGNFCPINLLPEQGRPERPYVAHAPADPGNEEQEHIIGRIAVEFQCGI